MPDSGSGLATVRGAEPPRARPVAETGRSWRVFVAWGAIIAAGLALLYGRFDWDVADGRYAERGFLLSAYLFAIALPTSYYLARRVLLDPVAATILTAAIFVATTLPWTLLGLDDLAYYGDRPRYFSSDQVPLPLRHEWLPGGSLRSFPYDWLFMPLVLSTGSAVIWGVWWLRGRAGVGTARLVPILLTAAFAAICVQTYLHTSLRSPAAYQSQFKRLTSESTEQWWYVVHHFRDGSGVVLADQFVFSPLEEYFQGAAADGNNMLIRRPLSFWAASQVSYFINTFYVWLGLNCLFWLAAVAATGRWVGRVTTPRVGVFAAALVTVSPGFIAWAGTPAMYLQAYAVVIIALCLFEDLVVRSGGRKRADVALFAASLALCMLVYDLLPLALSLLAYGLARRVRPGPLIAAIVAALVLSRAFPYLLTGVLGTEINPVNSEQLSKGLTAVKDLIVHPSLQDTYEWTTNLLPTFGRHLLQAFFVVPVLLALAGLPRLKDRALRVLVTSLLVTGFAVIAVLIIGDQLVGRAPRMVYPVFPAIVLLAALALDAIQLPGRWRHIVPWALIGVVALLANIDIFGYPTFYVEHFNGYPAVYLRAP